MRARTKLRRSIRAISPVISVLLMIAIAVAASLVAYAWVMGYIGGTTNKVGKAVMIQSMAPDAGTGNLLVYVQNVGQSAVTVDSVYVKDNLIASGLGLQLLEGQTQPILVGYPVAPDERIKVKVVTTDGTFSEITDSVGAAFGVVQYQVDFVLGSGGLSMSPPPGSQSYAAGAVVAISATGDASHGFSQWVVTGSIAIAVAGSASTSATINGAGTITATFMTQQFEVEFVLGAGGASMDPFGTHFYDGGASVAISATAEGTHTFSQWTTTGLITFDDANAASTNAHINGAGDITANFADAAAVLDHFDFETISAQTAGVAFGITITAKDQYGATFSYSGAGILSDLSGTITPTDVTFSGGVI